MDSYQAREVVAQLKRGNGVEAARKVIVGQMANEDDGIKKGHSQMSSVSDISAKPPAVTNSVRYASFSEVIRLSNCLTASGPQF